MIAVIEETLDEEALEMMVTISREELRFMAELAFRSLSQEANLSEENHRLMRECELLSRVAPTWDVEVRD